MQPCCLWWQKRASVNFTVWKEEESLRLRTSWRVKQCLDGAVGTSTIELLNPEEWRLAPRGGTASVRALWESDCAKHSAVVCGCILAPRRCVENKMHMETHQLLNGIQSNSCSLLQQWGWWLGEEGWGGVIKMSSLVPVWLMMLRLIGPPGLAASKPAHTGSSSELFLACTYLLCLLHFTARTRTPGSAELQDALLVSLLHKITKRECCWAETSLHLQALTGNPFCLRSKMSMCSDWTLIFTSVKRDRACPFPAVSQKVVFSATWHANHLLTWVFNDLEVQGVAHIGAVRGQPNLPHALISVSLHVLSHAFYSRNFPVVRGCQSITLCLPWQTRQPSWNEPLCWSKVQQL